jgi:hypothetical protein
MMGDLLFILAVVVFYTALYFVPRWLKHRRWKRRWR